MPKPTSIPAVSVNFGSTGASQRTNELGMRPMQERVWAHRGEKHLLIKSPPASGKSRALMFVALDKLREQGLKQVVVVVPEKTIGASFADEPLSKFGFPHDWVVEPRWNLCNAPGDDGSPASGKVDAVGRFLGSKDEVLVCTHATFRFAADRLGPMVFDDRLIAIDEFHHVSASPDSRLGEHVRQLLDRDRAQLIAMTGSYFRGDAAAVLLPEDEARFDTVTYTYYEQLSGYEHLKRLDIGYHFYTGSYADDIAAVLDPNEKTIVHIPSVNSRESTKDKHREVEHLLDTLGEWQGTDPDTGFQLVKTPAGKVLRVADLVDDDAKREKVAAALKDPAQKHNRDHVDIIIALGMAKEGFDWIWCEHALTVGYRSSLTEIVQIIGRTTRDAPGKTRARFSNLIAELDASEQKVTEAVNDTLKAIAASLLMEQVLQPRFDFTVKNPQSGPVDGFDYGSDGYKEGKTNVGWNPETGRGLVEIKGLVEPKSDEAKRIINEDLLELFTKAVQHKPVLEGAMLDEDTIPQDVTIMRVGKVVADAYPDLDEEDAEAVRQRLVAKMNLAALAKKAEAEPGGDAGEGGPNTGFLDNIRRYSLNVRDLDVDLIDSVRPFGEAYQILSKAMSEESLKTMHAVITGRKSKLTSEEAWEYAKRALAFKRDRGRPPSMNSQDAWERTLAEGVAVVAREMAEAPDA